MLSLCVQTDRQTDGRTDRWTTVKQYAPDLLIQGHKNTYSLTLSQATKFGLFKTERVLKKEFYGKRANIKLSY